MAFIRRFVSVRRNNYRLLANITLPYCVSSSKYNIDSRIMSKKVIILLAPGAEELEFVTPTDVLRRGGVKVVVAGVVGKDPVTCRSETRIVPDMTLAEAVVEGPYDAVVLPGGLRGAEILCENKDVGDVLKKQEDAGRIIAAICAGPTALKAHGIGVGKRVTSYPSTAEVMMQGDIYNYETGDVVVDGNLITSRGPATAFRFALTILEYVAGKNKAQEVAQAMLYDY